MSRVDELQKKYPGIPRQVIVKWEASNFGIRDSQVIDKVGVWIQSIGAFNRDHDLTLNDSIKANPARARQGQVRYPGSLTQPMDRNDMLRLKDAGATCLGYQMEVWDKELFAEVCPGKARVHGRDRYLESLLQAVDVFGAGKVACNFVGGVTLMPENGHKSWHEARDSPVEGLRWMIKNGILATFMNLRLGPGSVNGDDKSNLDKLPPTEFYLELARAHHAAMQEYWRYDKMNRFLICPWIAVSPSIVASWG